MYKLHGQVKSRALRPLWLLEELEVPFTWVPTLPRSPDAYALSPLGKIPVMEIEGEGPLFDSVAMMTYLADRHGRFTYPAGTYARARQDALTNTVQESFDAILWAYAKHSFVLPEVQRVPEVKESLKWQFARHAEAMAELIGEGPCVMGEDVLIPDILLAHCTGWAAGLKMELPATIRTHMTRMRARPAFRRALEYAES